MRATKRTGFTAEQVERVLAEANVVLKTPTIADRRMRVLALTAEGVKNSGQAFTVRQNFNSGVWAIVHPENSAGKTSLLEFLVLPLRGSPGTFPRTCGRGCVVSDWTS
ncbi:hypothetical protein ACFQV2_12780 [Actinokineospora soli]|uniref:Uncharacterized protein n=1 Tax=Actinokineospora soli TaxID=1048753 RepID=A0ABW2TKI9_9PSEU